MSIKCCRYCVPPKRHPQCWSTCPEYIEEKKQQDEYREKERKIREIYGAIDEQKRKRADRSSKKRRDCKIE